MSTLIRQITDPARASFGYGNTYPPGSIGETFKDYADKVNNLKGSAIMGHMAPGADAVGLSIQEKLREQISVNDRRGVVGGDWSPSFQRVADYVGATGGGSILVPDGVFDFASKVTVPEGVYFKLASKASVVRPKNAVASLFEITGGLSGVQGGVISNLGGFAAAGIVCNKPANDLPVTLSGTYMASFAEGVKWVQGDRPQVDFMTFVNCSTCIVTENDGRNGWLSKNYALGGSIGFRLRKTTQQPEGLEIDGNKLLMTAGGGASLFFEAGLEIPVTNNILDQTGPGSPAVYIATSAGNACAKIKLITNWLAGGAGQYPVFATGNTADLLLLGNTLIPNNTDLIAAGLSLNGTNGAQVVFNTFGLTYSASPDISNSGVVNYTQFGNTSANAGSNALTNTIDNLSISGLGIKANQYRIGNSGPTLTGGMGVPTANEPAGSIFMRTDGGTGGRTYISQGGGVWQGIAGV